MAKAGRAADQLARGGQFEALGDGLFGLLHGEKRFNTPERAGLASKKRAEEPARSEGALRQFFYPNILDKARVRLRVLNPCSFGFLAQW